ncbi:MAG: glycoside hydrolase family 78 protein [Alistipes sp.]|nr:glycoside hydrolase family 78 protein [Alistipes sp.]
MLENPQGVYCQSPRFSWKFTGPGHDVMQSAYRIEVASSEKELRSGGTLVWDSGRVESDRSHLVEYGGEALAPGKEYFWRVTLWTNHGGGGQSHIGRWSTALGQEDWQAVWIGVDNPGSLRVENNRTILPARYLRREFDTAAKAERAVLYVSGVGSSVCYINSQRVGDDVFGPLPTWYDESVPYLTYDVTGLVRKGPNALGVALGNGRFLTMREHGMFGSGLPRLLARLEIEYGDGEKYVLVSDGSWMATDRGPVTENNEFDGECYDARLELGDWSRAGYDDSGWRPADVMPSPGGRLTAQLSPSLAVMEEVEPLSVTQVAPGRYIVDMGQNMVGIQKVRLHGKKDSPVTMRFAEVLKDGGTELYLDNMRDALVTDTYIPASDGEFTWEPMFVYHGFRFMEISGVESAPSVSDITGKVVYDRMETLGSFESSEQLLNRIHRNAYWGIRGNYRGMPTDCPQRDERLGWLGDRTTGAYGESFLFCNALLYRKWLADIEESMDEQGRISDVSPRYWTLWLDDVTWPAAYFYVADMLYSQFGDDYSIKMRYPSMKKWLCHMMDNHMEGNIMTRDIYGDWCMPPESPELIHSEDPARKTRGEVLSTTVFYSILELMQKFALMNGLPDDAAQYARIAADMKEAYNDRFFDPAAARYDNNTVTANMLSLQLGLVPGEYRERVFENIVEKTEVDCKGHVSVGVLGIQHLMRGLTHNGALELAYRIATNKTYPSWGYMIDNGATTIWELWNGDTANPAMNSRNHVMLLGDLLIWYYEDLAGIKSDPSSTAFKKIVMAPVFPDMLEWFDASYVSPYGLIESRCKRTGDYLVWNITVPANTSATVRIPARFGVRVEPGADGVRSMLHQEGDLVVEIGSGRYTFRS